MNNIQATHKADTSNRHTAGKDNQTRETTQLSQLANYSWPRPSQSLWHLLTLFFPTNKVTREVFPLMIESNNKLASLFHYEHARHPL